jgi:hypothetical protein
MTLSMGGVSTTHQFNYNESGGEIQLIDSTGAGPILIDNVSGLARFYKVGSGAISMGTTGANYFQFITNGSERMRIDSAGLVGIGTSSPGSYPYGGALNVNGSISMALGNRLGWGITDAFTLNGVTTAHYGFTYGGGVNYVTVSGYYGVNFATLGADRMRITDIGCLVIGLGATNTAALSISRSSSTASVLASSSIVLSNRNTGINGTIAGGIFIDTFRDIADPHYSGGIWFTRNQIASNLSSSSDIVFGAMGSNSSSSIPAEKMRIVGLSGNVGIGTSAPSEILHVIGNILASGNVTAYSDIRVKDNVQQIAGALDRVQRIRGVTYTRTDQDDKERRYAGVIAQEIEEVLPEAIFDNGKLKAVDYNATIGLLIEAIKELTARVAQLEGK